MTTTMNHQGRTTTTNDEPPPLHPQPPSEVTARHVETRSHRGRDNDQEKEKRTFQVPLTPLRCQQHVTQHPPPPLRATARGVDEDARTDDEDKMSKAHKGLSSITCVGANFNLQASSLRFVAGNARKRNTLLQKSRIHLLTALIPRMIPQTKDQTKTDRMKTCLGPPEHRGKRSRRKSL
jgi:hypothetical protein